MSGKSIKSPSPDVCCFEPHPFQLIFLGPKEPQVFGSDDFGGLAPKKSGAGPTWPRGPAHGGVRRGEGGDFRLGQNRKITLPAFSHGKGNDSLGVPSPFRSHLTCGRWSFEAKGAFYRDRCPEGKVPCWWEGTTEANTPRWMLFRSSVPFFGNPFLCSREN